MMTPSATFISPPSVLILGANGRFGRAAAQAFDAAGWRVVAQVRRDVLPPLPGRSVRVHARLDDTDALLAAWLGTPTAGHIPPEHAGPRALIHAVNPAYTRWDAEALPALHAGLRLAGRARAHFMLPGNVYNFGEAMPPRLAEDTPFRPSMAKGRLRVEMEAQIARAAAEGGFAASVIRAGDFLGPGTGTWLDQAIVKSLRAGKLVYPGPLNLPHAWAYLPDLARAFVRVATQAREPTFQNWHFEGHTLTGAELLDAIEEAAQALGAVSPATGFRRGPMPWGLIAAIGLVRPLWRELARMSYLWRVPHALEGDRLAALMAGSPTLTPLPLALRDCLSTLGHAAGDAPAHAWAGDIAVNAALPHPPATSKANTMASSCLPVAASIPASPSAAVNTSMADASRGLGWLLIAEALLSFVPVAILGAAIGWPASLHRPAAEQLAAMAAAPAAVSLGYAVYLVYSLLVAPVTIGLAARSLGGLSNPLAVTVAAFGALSALARSIGILRWLTVMPVLAAAHAGAVTDPALRSQIEMLFDGLTLYGGGIGEVLGVSLLMSSSVGTLCLAALRRRSMPRWLAGSGVLSAVLLAGLALPAVRGPEIVPVGLAVSLLSAWMLAAGVWVMRRPSPRAGLA